MTESADPRRLARESLALQLHSDLLFGLEEWPLPAAGRQSALLAGPAPEARAQPAAQARFSGGADKGRRMEEIGAEVRACALCELARTRTLAVPGEGSVDADLMFVGEGPGGEEDRSGRPFVGASGKLLAKIITAMGFSRETVFITNIVKCRPPGNRDPLPAEVAACRSFLERQIDVVEPKVICALGLPATRTLLGVDGPLGPLRGKKFLCRGRTVVPTYHPSYLLQNESAKALVWSDVQFVARLVAEQGGAIPHPEVLERAAGKR